MEVTDTETTESTMINSTEVRVNHRKIFTYLPVHQTTH